jgi:cytochrome c oxidase cbb3-type subunit III
MLENVLGKMGGVGMYGVISVILFFVLFIGVLVWMIGLKKSYLEEMRELPLEGATDRETDAALTSNPENRND